MAVKLEAVGAENEIVTGVLRNSPWVTPVTTMLGAVRSRVKPSVLLLLFHNASMAVTVNTCAPLAAIVAPLVNASPSRVAVTVPGCASIALKVTATG